MAGALIPERHPAGRHVDLHMHSTASDGSRAPDEVVAAARAADLAAIALTDHDTLAGLPAARSAGERLGVRIIAGVELSAADRDREVHLLALHLSATEEVERRLATFREARRRRAEAIVHALNALGIPIALERVLEEAAGAAIGRPHIARVLVADGWAADHREAFDRWLGAGRPAFVAKEKLTVAEAIQLTHDAGGIAILAHPGSEGTREWIEPMVAHGLDGLEVMHPSHSTEDVQRLRALADHFRLVPSGGSDWHGAATGPRTIGCMRVPAEWLERQDARVRMRRAGERVA